MNRSSHQKIKHYFLGQNIIDMGCIDENNVYEEYGLRKNSVKLKKLKDMLIQCGEEALCYLCKRNKSGKKGNSFFHCKPYGTALTRQTLLALEKIFKIILRCLQRSVSRNEFHSMDGRPGIENYNDPRH